LVVRYLSGESEEQMRIRKIFRIISILTLASLLLVACGTLEVNVDPTDVAVHGPAQASDTPEPIAITPTQEETQTPTVTQTPSETPTGQTSATSLWREIRDPDTGFGFALPCWWVTYLPSGDAEAYAITVASYDESFFMANSVKGQWLGGERPQGAYKLDFFVSKQIDANLTDEEAVRQVLTSDINNVDLVQERTIGKHTGLLAVQSHVDNPSSTGTVYAFRLAPTVLMMVSAIKSSDLTDPLIKAILNSLALSQEEVVQLPTIDPGPALIATPAACQP
jgi:hypothetical protein